MANLKIVCVPKLKTPAGRELAAQFMGAVYDALNR